MERKFYTFLIFPGAHGKLHKIRLPFYVVHLVLAFSIVGIMTVAALTSRKMSITIYRNGMIMSTTIIR